MNQKIIILISIFLVISNVITAQDSTLILSLEQAKTLALQQNKTVLNAKMDIVKAKKKIWETTAMGLPQISGSVSHNYNIDIPVTLIPAQIFNPQAPEGTFMEMKFGTDNNTKIGLSATQLIFSGEYIVGLQAAKTFKQLSEINEQRSEADVKELTAQSYFLVLIAQETQAILDSNLQFTEKLLKQTTEIQKQGFLEETDVDQLQINVTNLKNGILSIQRQLAISNNLLKFQLGVNFSTKIILTDKLSDLIKNEEVETLLNTPLSIETHLDFQLMQTQEHLQKLNVKREKSAFLPNIAAFYNHQESMMGDKIQWFDSDGKWYAANIVGFSINIPIFSSGQRLMKVAEANIELDKLKNQKWQMQQKLIMQEFQTKTELNNALDSYKTNQQNKKLAKKIYNRTKEKYQNGMASSMELTQAQLQYFNTIQANFQSILNVLNAENKLNKFFNK